MIISFELTFFFVQDFDLSCRIVTELASVKS